MKSKALMNWSTGKDAAYAFAKAQQTHQIKHLLCTTNAVHERVTMHGLRVSLLQAQLERMPNVELIQLDLPEHPSMEVYEEIMQGALGKCKEIGIEYSIFGDIHLEDLRQYREDKLQQMGFHGVFPLWKIPSETLIQEMIDYGIEAIVVCVNGAVLDKEFLGRKIDADFVKDLPKVVDPCGENGEFHTFVYNTPYFSSPIPYQKGEIVTRYYPATSVEIQPCFHFLDVY
ncbi:MAG: hypothetical protein MK212_08625 [Saprospiraceae bacterium]|nr:hypothetical protein [Saprospiraceae bacterium]